MKVVRIAKPGLAVLLFCCGIAVKAQETSYRLVADKSNMTVSGTSSLHDWTIEVKKIDGAIVLPVSMGKDMPKKGDRIAMANIVAVVKSMESGKGAAMDKRTFQALKAEQHPEITFEMASSKITGMISQPGAFEVTAKGNLTIAGATRTIDMVFHGQKLADGTFKFHGEGPLKMTSFDIVPPTAMFGQIVTGDDVTVHFDLLFSINP